MSNCDSISFVGAYNLKMRNSCTKMFAQIKETFHDINAFQWIIDWIPYFAAFSTHW